MNTRPPPSVVADEELVERVRDAMISTCLLVGSDLTIDNVEELARAALAASDRDVLVGENARMREALQKIAGALGFEARKIARAALVPLGGGVTTSDSPRESSI